MNEFISPIPSRIRNVAKDGYVAGAVDIIDDDLMLNQAQINSIVEENLVTVSLTASALNPVSIGTQGGVALTATSKINMNISIKKGDVELASAVDTKTCSHTDNEVSNYGRTTYTAEFIKGGMNKPASVIAGAIYFGYGGAFENNNKFVVKSGVSGTYNVVIPSGLSSDPHVWFMVPKPWTISKATKSGFDFPLNPVVEITAPDGVTIYNAYESINTYGAGTEKIVLS